MVERVFQHPARLMAAQVYACRRVGHAGDNRTWVPSANPDSAIATSIYMAQPLERPLLIEGRAGVGKTEIANVMARPLDPKLIRLQSYEGLDVTTALFEWNYPKQLLWIKLHKLSGRSAEDRAHRSVMACGRSFTPTSTPFTPRWSSWTIRI